MPFYNHGRPVQTPAYNSDFFGTAYPSAPSECATGYQSSPPESATGPGGARAYPTAPSGGGPPPPPQTAEFSVKCPIQ